MNDKHQDLEAITDPAPEKPEVVPLSQWTLGKSALIASREQQFYRVLANQDEIAYFFQEIISLYDRKIVGIRSLEYGRNYFLGAKEFILEALTKLGNGNISLIQKLGEMIENEAFFIPQSIVGQFIVDEKEPDMDRIYALCFMTGVKFDNSEKWVIARDEAGDVIDDPLSIFKLDIAPILENQEVQTRVSQNIIRRIMLRQTKVVNRIMDGIEDKRLELQNAIINANSRFDEAEDRIKNIDETISSIREAYKVEPAAAYWSENASISDNLKIQGIVGFVIVAITEILIACGIYWYLGETNGNWQTTLSHIPIYSIFAVLSIWLLKHFSRMFVQGFTQGNDARFRLALTKVYGEIRTDEKIKSEQINIMLKAMFGPRSTSNKDADIQPSPVQNIFTDKRSGS